MGLPVRLRSVEIGNIGEWWFGTIINIGIGLIVVLGVSWVDEMILILNPSLWFTSITFLPERKVQIITDEANPILYFILCVWFYVLMTIVFCWRQIVTHFFLFEFLCYLFSWLIILTIFFISLNIHPLYFYLYTPTHHQTIIPTHAHYQLVGTVSSWYGLEIGSIASGDVG